MSTLAWRCASECTATLPTSASRPTLSSTVTNTLQRPVRRYLQVHPGRIGPGQVFGGERSTEERGAVGLRYAEVPCGHPAEAAQYGEDVLILCEVDASGQRGVGAEGEEVEGHRLDHAAADSSVLVEFFGQGLEDDVEAAPVDLSEAEIAQFLVVDLGGSDLDRVCGDAGGGSAEFALSPHVGWKIGSGVSGCSAAGSGVSGCSAAGSAVSPVGSEVVGGLAVGVVGGLWAG